MKRLGEPLVRRRPIWLSVSSPPLKAFRCLRWIPLRPLNTMMLSVAAIVPRLPVLLNELFRARAELLARVAVLPFLVARCRSMRERPSVSNRKPTVSNLARLPQNKRRPSRTLTLLRVESLVQAAVLLAPFKRARTTSASLPARVWWQQLAIWCRRASRLRLALSTLPGLRILSAS